MKFTKAIFLTLVPSIAAVPIEGSGTSNFKKGRRKTEEHGRHEKIGLAMNGAAFISSNGCAALMRGFQRQTLMIDGEERPGLEAFDLMSSLSGGNIPNMVYHYAKTATIEELFDLDTPGYTDPSKITMKELEIAPPSKSIFSILISDPTPSLVLALLYSSVLGVPFWPIGVYFIVLQRIGISMGTPLSELKMRDDVKSKPLFETSMVGPSDLFPDWIDTHINRKVFGEFNNDAASILEPFSSAILPIVDPNKAYHEQNSTYLYSLAEKHGFQIPLPVFGTDTEFHVPFSSEAVTMEFDAVGNKIVEPMEFKGFVASYDELSTASDPFTLEKMLGMATDMSLLGKEFKDYLPASIRGVPISVNVPTADGGRRGMAFTDGGYNDAIGIPSLVQQGVKNIVSLLVPGVDGSIASPYLQFFGGANTVSDLEGNFKIGWHLSHIFKNKRYDDGSTMFDKIIRDLEALKAAGEPTIVTMEGVEVIDNPFFGIKGGWTLDLTIVVAYSVPSKFVDLLPADVAQPPIGQNRTFTDDYGNIRFTNEDFKWVPNHPVNSVGQTNYKYFIPGTNEEIELNIPSVGFNLPIKATRMTELMLTWCIERAWDNPLIGIDGEVKFVGFRKLLEKEASHEDPDKGGSDEGSSSGSTTIKNVCEDCCIETDCIP